MADELDDVPLSPTRPTAESTLVLDGTQKFRTRPLALVYSAKEDRKQFENRLNDWRLELSENINKPQKATAAATRNGKCKPNVETAPPIGASAIGMRF